MSDTPPSHQSIDAAASKRAPPSQPTIAFYRDRTRQLAIRYLLSGGPNGATGNHGIGPHGVDPLGLVQWLIGRKPELARSTWGQYRAAVLYCLIADHHPEPASVLAASRRDGAKPKGSATSATKKKRLPSADRERLQNWLHAIGTTMGEATACWIEAGMLTGLRPVEWATAEETTESGGAALLVQNAKMSDIRANGPTRTIPLDHLDVRQLTVIRTHLLAARTVQRAGVFNKFYNQCSDVLREANRALWPRRRQKYTLTSGRHQFSANAKRQHGAAGVAALMGHASEESAGHHYGRRASGESGSRGPVPRTVDQEVATVRPAKGAPPTARRPKKQKTTRRKRAVST
jgi:hypothetical protein